MKWWERRIGNEAWFREHYEAVFRAVWSYSGGDPGTRDAVQGAFEKSLYAGQKGTVLANPVAWLVTVAINELRDSKRKSIHEAAVGPAILASLTEDKSGSGREHIAVRRAEADAILAAMLRLTEQHREALFCRYYLDLSYDQIAQLLSLSMGTVKSRLYRARESLRVLLSSDRRDLHESARS